MANPFLTAGAPAAGAPQEQNPFLKPDAMQAPANPFLRPTTGWESRSGLERHLTDRLMTGVHALGETGASIVAKTQADNLATLDKIDELLAPPKRVDETINTPEQRQDAAMRLAQQSVDPNISLYVRDPSQREAIRNYMQKGVKAGVSGVVEERQAQASIPKNPALAKAMQTGSAWELFKTVLSNPSIITDTALESAPQMAAGAVAAPVIGPAAGVGLSSLATEAGQSFTDALQKAGVDVNNKDAFEKAMSDPAIVARAKEEALKRGIPIALLDAISGKLASKTIVKLPNAGKLVNEAANIAAQAPIQAGLGAEGEALGQMVQSRGKITDPIAIAMEAIGEFGGTPGEVLSLGAGRMLSPDHGAPASEETIRALLRRNENEVATPITPSQGAKGAEGAAQAGVPAAAAPGAGIEPGGEIPITGGEKAGLSTERLVSAAIKVGDKVYEGQDHGAAFEKALAAGEKPEAISRGDLGGFVTDKGRYVTRQEATALVQSTGQQAGTAEGAVVSQGTTTPTAKEVEAAKTPEAKRALYEKYGLDVEGNRLKAGAATAAPTVGGSNPFVAAQPQAGLNTPQVNVLPGMQPRTIFRFPGQWAINTRINDLAGGGDVYTINPEYSKSGGFSARQETGLRLFRVDNDAIWQQLQSMVDTVEPANPGVSRGELLKAVLKSQGFNGIEFNARDAIAASQLKELLGGKGTRIVVYDNAPKAYHVEIPQGAKHKGEPFSQMFSAGRDWLARLLPGYDPAAHEDNSVVVHGEPVEGYAEINKLLPFLKEMQKSFFNGAKVVLSFTKEGPLANPERPARGRFFGTADGTIVIWLNTDPRFSTFEQVNTLMHEAGHAVAWWNLWNENAAVQQALLQEYHSWLVKSGQMSPEQAIIETRNATNLAIIGSAETDPAGRLTIDGDAADAIVSSMTRWFDFDEWMAEQFARWMSSEQKPFTLVEKFFSKVARQIKNLYRLFGFQPDKSIAAPLISEWFKAVQERNERRDVSSSPTAILHSQLKGQAQVADELGEDWGEDGPGLSLPSFGLRRLTRASGVAVQHVARVDKFNWWIDKMWGLLQLAAQNPHIQGLQRYVEAVRAFHISKMALVSRADAHIRDWRRLGKDMAANLSNFMFDLDQMEYLAPGANMRWPTNAELIALAKKHGLNADAMALYLKLKDDFSHVLDQMQSAWVRDAQQSISDPQQLWGALQKIASEMAMMRAKPYFPHERFGEWTATVRDSSGKVVFFQQFAKKRDSIAAEIALRRQFPGHEVYGGRMPEELLQFRGLPPSLIKSMAGKLNLTAQQRRQLDDLLLDLSPANSAAKRFKRRKNTPGYSLDGMRAYAQYFLTMSGHLARLEHSGTMQEAIKDVARSADAMRGTFIQDAVDKRRGIAEWMQKTFDYMNSSKSEWQGLRSFAFLWYLGYNISSAMVNLTQVPMVALPYMSARFGDFRTMNELRRAYSDLRGTYMMRAGALKPEVQDALDEAVRQGFVDESMAAELASAASGGTLESMLPGTRVQRGLMNFANIGAIPFRMVEKLNRRVVFLSAFRMAQATNNAKYLGELQQANTQLFQQLQARGWTDRNALAFLAGRDAVERSQFEYAKWARPEFMRGKKAVLFTFFMFKQNMLWFLKNSPGAGRAWLMLLAGAGLMGLPGADHLDELLKFLAFHMFGKNFSPEQEIRQFVKDGLDLNPDLVMHGLGYHTLGLTAIGDALGVPVPDIDLSSRIGMERTLPGVNPMFALNNDSWDERFGKSAQEVLGAGMNIPLGILKAMATGNPDSFKQIERGLPTAWKNLARAYRWTADGEETDSNGAVIQDFDVMDSRGRMDIAAQALGFTPSVIAAKRELSQAQHEAMTYWSLRRGELFEQFFFARRAGDREALADVKAAVRAFNQSAPNGALKIEAKDLIASYKSRVKGNRKVELGRAPSAGLQPLFKSLQSLYPGAAATPQ